MKRTPIAVRAGRAIRRRREALEVSQEDFADQMGMHRNYYGLIERGRKDLRLGTLERICDALGARISEVTKDIEQ